MTFVLGTHNMQSIEYSVQKITIKTKKKAKTKIETQALSNRKDFDVHTKRTVDDHWTLFTVERERIKRNPAH